jgi:hypothetical protein
MKRLLGLAVLFVVLCVSVPSYGYFLVYNVSYTVNGADKSTDAKVTIPLKAYLVVNLDDSNDELVDANLILYGNDASTPKKQKVYDQLNYTGIPGRLGGHVWYVSDLIFLDFWGRLPSDFEITLQGKTASKDIGTVNKKQAAGSVKGVSIVWDGALLGPDPNQDVSGTATASASLNTAGTKSINQHGWTQDQIIEGDGGLISMLEGKGYVKATLPSPD